MLQSNILCKVAAECYSPLHACRGSRPYNFWQGQLAGALPDQKLSALADIRLDEDYDRFYQAQIASGKKLPPPLDNRTLYQELSQYQGLAQQGQHISPELAQHLLQQRSSASPAPSNGILAAAGG